MKIKVKNSKIASMRLCVPVDGIISIDNNGVADVSPKCAAALVRGTNDWDYLKSDKAAEAEEEETEETVEEEEMTEREKFAAELDGMYVEQMKDYAKEAGFSEKEYEKLKTKKLMKAYLLKKFDDAAEAEEEETEE